jgi:hypothetical protein
MRSLVQEVAEQNDVFGARKLDERRCSDVVTPGNGKRLGWHTGRVAAKAMLKTVSEGVVGLAA